MNNKFNWAVALYIVSFFMPVFSGIGNPETTIWGWEVASEVLFPGDVAIFGEEEWQILYYIIAALPNPLIATVIILKYLKKDLTVLSFYLSLVALICALFWSPFFFSQLMTNFDMGYWFWLLSIVLIFYYVNDGSMRRPSKRTISKLKDT